MGLPCAGSLTTHLIYSMKKGSECPAQIKPICMARKASGFITWSGLAPSPSRVQQYHHDTPTQESCASLVLVTYDDDNDDNDNDECWFATSISKRGKIILHKKVRALTRNFGLHDKMLHRALSFSVWN